MFSEKKLPQTEKESNKEHIAHEPLTNFNRKRPGSCSQYHAHSLPILWINLKETDFLLPDNHGLFIQAGPRGCTGYTVNRLVRFSDQQNSDSCQRGVDAQLFADLIMVLSVE